MNKKLLIIYNKLFKYFGRQFWWPGDSSFEIIIGAILTQNTSWNNVEKAINNLKTKNLLNFNKFHRIKQSRLAQLIRPAGYFNIKAKRLKNFLKFLDSECHGDLNKLFSCNLSILREKLLSVNGIGPETADSILLYAGNLPIFVVDSYTKRIFSRHGFFKEDTDYHNVQKIFMDNLTANAKLFNEYHALIVRLAKEFCLKNKPRCELCPLK